MSRIKSWVRPHLLDLMPYSSARDEYSDSSGIFLDANENAFGSAGGGEWNRYPDPYQFRLKEKISELKDIKAEHVFLGNGSDEPIDLLIRAFCEPGRDKIASFSPTYGMYAVSAGIHEIQHLQFPLDNEFNFNVDDINFDALHGVKIFFLCSPNNPSGNLLDSYEIEKLLSRLNCLVVIDEAYIDFAPEVTWLKQIEQYDNLVVLQTFSKAWGLAAYRLGVAYANPDLITILNKIKAPYNLNGPIQQLALGALDRSEEVKEWVERIQEQRSYLEEALPKLSIIEKVYPSDANFLLVKFKDSEKVFEYMLSQKIILRDRSSQPGCEGCLRITVGTLSENQVLMTKLTEFELAHS
ncbi:MAG: histidinol-phosphate transaminase [Cyclobacteriaceae bacterium]